MKRMKLGAGAVSHLPGACMKIARRDYLGEKTLKAFWASELPVKRRRPQHKLTASPMALDGPTHWVLSLLLPGKVPAGLLPSQVNPSLFLKLLPE